ncbi:MAG: hypothetical protein HUJ63_05420, partial [Enterococcus sp.]|nr:hypothetical protein [Enterococcus sp.]
PWDLPKKIIEIGNKHGFKLGEPAAKEILDRIGENTKHIDTIFQKFALMFSAEELASGVNLDRNFITENIKRIEGSKPWDFTDAVSKKKVDAALKSFHDFPKDSINMLYAMLLDRFKDLLCVKTCVETGKQAQIAEELKKLNKQKISLEKLIKPEKSMNPRKFTSRAISRFQTYSALFSFQELQDNIVRLVDLDAAFKSGKIEDFAQAFKIEFVRMCCS